jgi:hypothetical protein
MFSAYGAELLESVTKKGRFPETKLLSQLSNNEVNDV